MDGRRGGGGTEGSNSSAPARISRSRFAIRLIARARVRLRSPRSPLGLSHSLRISRKQEVRKGHNASPKEDGAGKQSNQVISSGVGFSLSKDLQTPEHSLHRVLLN